MQAPPEALLGVHGATQVEVLIKWQNLPLEMAPGLSLPTPIPC